MILEKDIPAFIVELGRTVTQSGMKFAQWKEENQETLVKIAGKYMIS